MTRVLNGTLENIHLRQNKSEMVEEKNKKCIQIEKKQIDNGICKSYLFTLNISRLNTPIKMKGLEEWIKKVRPGYI